MGVYTGITQDNATINKGTLYNVEIVGATMAAPLVLASYEVSSLPAAADNTGSLVYVSNGAAGSPVVAFSDGSNWLSVSTLAPVSGS